MNISPTPKVDYIAVHWYGGTSASSFRTRMQDIYNKFQIQLWITEFACQTTSSSIASPTKFTQEAVNKFLDNVISWHGYKHNHGSSVMLGMILQLEPVLYGIQMEA
jgi:hypothetical protein